MVIIDVITLDDDHDDVIIQNPGILNPEVSTPRYGVSISFHECLRSPKIENNSDDVIGNQNPEVGTTSSTPRYGASACLRRDSVKIVKNSAASGAATSSGNSQNPENLRIPKIEESEPVSLQNPQKNENLTSSGASGAVTSSEVPAVLRDPKIEESESETPSGGIQNLQNPAKNQNSGAPTSSENSEATTSSKNLAPFENSGAVTSFASLLNPNPSENAISATSAASGDFENDVISKILNSGNSGAPTSSEESQNPKISISGPSTSSARHLIPNPTSSGASGAPKPIKIHPFDSNPKKPISGGPTSSENQKSGISTSSGNSGAATSSADHLIPNPTSSGSSGGTTSSGSHLNPPKSENLIPGAQPSSARNLILNLMSSGASGPSTSSARHLISNPTSSGASGAPMSRKIHPIYSNPKNPTSGAPTSSENQKSGVLTSSGNSGASTSSARPLNLSLNPIYSGASGAATSSRGLQNPPKPAENRKSGILTSSGSSGGATSSACHQIPNLTSSGASGGTTSSARHLIPNPTSSAASGAATSSRSLQNPSGTENSGDSPVLELYKNVKEMNKGERKKCRKKLQLEAVMVAGQIKQLRMLSAEFVKQENSNQEMTHFQKTNHDKLQQLVRQEAEIRSEFRKAQGCLKYLDEIIRNAGFAGHVPVNKPSDPQKRTFPSRDVAHQNPPIPEKRIKREPI